MSVPASPTATGGLGFSFADKVGALCLLALLKRAPFEGTGARAVTRVAFEQRPAGWYFDDVLVTSMLGVEEQHSAVSIKLGQHVGPSGFERELIEQAWTQLEAGGLFVEGRDKLVIAQPPVTPEVRRALIDLEVWSTSQADGQTEQWVAEPGVGNPLKRALVSSAKLGGDRDDAQRLLRTMVVATYDLDSEAGERERRALQDCLGLLRSPTEEAASSLWRDLCHTASQARGTAAVYDLPKLVSALSPRFSLTEHPGVAPDVAKLRNHCATRHLANVRETIGGDLSVPTPATEAALREALAEDSVVFLVGESGTGKSVVLKRLAQAQAEGELVLYFRADLVAVSPSAIEAHLGLAHPLREVLRDGRFSRTTIVVDQLDRLYTEAQLADVVELLETVRLDGWSTRAVFGCQSGEAESAISRLRASLPAPEAKRIQHEHDSEAFFSAAIYRYPTLRNIAFRRELRPFLLRPQNLALLVGRLDDLGSLVGTEFTSQRQFIDWFWKAYVDRGRNGLERSLAMQELGERQAEVMRSHLRPTELPRSAALDSLRSDRLIVGDDLGIAFEHDLYGDWARFRSIEANRSRIVPFLKERMTNPLWLRSVRLWSAALLETEGTHAWRELLEAFSEAEGTEAPMRDAFLDGLSLAADSRRFLGDLEPELMKEDGALLRRFLARFLFATTFPDEATARTLAKGDVAELAKWRAKLRSPVWYLWWPVVRFIVEHAEACSRHAPDQTVEILLPWLNGLPPKAEFGWGAEASAIVHAISARFFDSPRYFSGRLSDLRLNLFRALALTLRQTPEQASVLIRRAIGRTGNDPFPEARIAPEGRYARSHSMTDPGERLILGPWPDGPVARRNQAFEEFVLFGGALREAYEFSPQLAREILLACLIEPPHLLDVGWHAAMRPEKALCLSGNHAFHPPFYDRAPFQTAFDIDPDWAVDLILDLVSFAAKRESEDVERSGPTQIFELVVSGEPRTLYGGLSGYGWHRHDAHAPDVLACALMALEKHTQERIDAGDADGIVGRLLTRMDSFAILGLLATLGKRSPELFRGPLSFLHFSETVQRIDVRHIVCSEGHQMISWTFAFDGGADAAREWHDAPYRRTPLKYFAYYVLSDPVLAETVAEASRRWARMATNETDEGERGALLNLSAVYNVENYRIEPREGDFVIQCVLPEDLQRAAEAHMAEANRKVGPVLLANRCRSILSGDQEVVPDELEDLVRKAREASDAQREPENPFSAADARCGVATVLLLRHKGWLASHPDVEEWCIETLIGDCADPPPSTRMEVAQSVSRDQWCHFAAQSLPAIWADRPDDQRVRAGMANLIEDFRLRTVAYLAGPLFAVRSENEGLYRQAVRLHRGWSVELMRRAWVERSSYGSSPMQPLTPVEVDSSANDYLRERQAFVRGDLPTDLPPLPRPAIADNDDPEERGRVHPLVDRSRLSYFAHNLPSLRNVPDASGRREVVDRWRELIDETVADLHSRADRSDRLTGSVTTYSHEPELFHTVGRLLSELEDADDIAHFVQALHSLRALSDSLVEQFFDGFWGSVLSDAPPSPSKLAIWLSIVEVWFGSPTPSAEDWTSEPRWAEWRHWIVGNTARLRRSSWRVEHGELLRSQRGVLEAYVRAMCATSRDLRECLRFLALPASDDLRPESCLWIFEATSEQMFDDNRDEIQNEMASLLQEARAEVVRRRESHPAEFAAFVGLLVYLDARNVRPAMQLLADVTTLR